MLGHTQVVIVGCSCCLPDVYSQLLSWIFFLHTIMLATIWLVLDHTNGTQSGQLLKIRYYDQDDMKTYWPTPPFSVSSFLNIMQSFRLHTKCKIQKWLCCQSADQGEHKASHHNIKHVTIHKIIVWKSVAFSKCCRHQSIMTGFIHSLLTRNCQLLNQWLTCCPACNFIITLYQMLLEYPDRCWQQDTNCNNKGKNKELREQKADQHANCSSESQWCTKSLGSKHKQEEDVRKERM